jgi:Glycosyl hydrolases family 15
MSGFAGWVGWLFLHIAFLTGFRNRVGALLTWWTAFIRDIRKERAYTNRAVGMVQDVHEPRLAVPSPRLGEPSRADQGSPLHRGHPGSGLLRPGMPCTGRRPELAGARLRRHPRGAADQLQLDIYGEAADAIYTGDTYGLHIAHSGWLAFTNIMDWVTDDWDQPDEGVWESPGSVRCFAGPSLRLPAPRMSCFSLPVSYPSRHRRPLSGFKGSRVSEAALGGDPA